MNYALKQHQQQLISNILAGSLMLSGASIFLVIRYKADVEIFAIDIQNLLFQHPVYLSLFFIAILFNISKIILFFRKYIFKTTLGGHLEDTLVENDDKASRLIGKGVGLGIAMAIFMFLLSKVELSFNGDFFKVSEIFKIFVDINIALWIASIGSSLSRVDLQLFRRLPRVPNEKNSVVIGAISEEKDSFTEYSKGVPTWLVMLKKALVGNIMILGSIRSGKTSALVLRILDDLYSRFDKFIPGLIIDPKKSFTSKAIKILKRYGHQDKIVHISLSGGERVNWIYRENILIDSQLDDVANMIKVSAINLIGNKGEQKLWMDLATNLIKFCLAYLGATKEYFTLLDLREVYSNAYKQELFQELEELETNPRFNVEERHNIREGKKGLMTFSELGEKQRSSIQLNGNAFFDRFTDYHAAKIFCPAKEDITIKSMDDLLDGDKIIIFDIEEDGLARSMGTMTKVVFQKSVLDIGLDTPRAKLARKRNKNYLLLIDEVHKVVTGSSGGGNLADEVYCSTAGEFGAITIFSTQGRQSFYNALGSSVEADDLFSHFRTVLVTHSLDKDTIEHLKFLAGTKEVDKVSVGQSEVMPNAKRVGGDDFEGSGVNLSKSSNVSKVLESIVNAQEITRLKTFEAFGFVFNGVDTRFTKVFLKPYFLPRNWSHKKILSRYRSFIGVRDD